MSTKWDEILAKVVEEYKQSPDEFLRRRTITSCVHPNCQNLAKLYFREMASNPFFRTNVLPNLRDGSVGRPYRFASQPKCSPLTVQHAYHLYTIKEKFGIFLPQEKINNVVEIGGGYGNLCRLFKSFGYEGKYTIVDLPPMLEIQRDYLDKHSIKDVDFLTLEMFDTPPSKDDISILIATFSINEMPIEQREHLRPFYNSFDYLFFIYNSFFDGVDNIDYFNKLKASLKRKFNIEHFKDQHKNSWFMLCRKRRIR